MQRTESADSRFSSPSEPMDIDTQEVQPFSSPCASSKNDNDSKIDVVINYRPLNLEELYNKRIYKMNVQFAPETLSDKLYRMALVEFNKIHYPSVIFVYDNQYTMYTTRELKGKSGTVIVFDKATNRSVNIFIVTAITNTIDMQMVKHYLRNGSMDIIPEDVAEAIIIVMNALRHGLMHRFSEGLETLQYCPRTISPNIDIELLKKNFVDGWKFHISEAEATPKIITKNRSVLSILEEDLHFNIYSKLDPLAFDLILENFKGIKVKFAVPYKVNSIRLYRVTDLRTPAENCFFGLSEEKSKHGFQQSCNIKEYYKSRFEYDIQYPHLPCFCVNGKDIIIPIELCTVVTHEMTLRRTLRNISGKNCIEQNPAMQEFGVQIEKQTACLPARILEEPKLAYAQNIECKPAQGIWNVFPLVHTVSLSNWALLNLDGTINFGLLKLFERSFTESAAYMSFTVSPAKKIHVCPVAGKANMVKTRKTIRSALLTCKRENVNLVIVIFPGDTPEVYMAIKQLAELDVGILTQCVKSRTLMTALDHSTLRNLLLKINSKLNGVNHKLASSDSVKMMNEAIIMGGYVVSNATQINERVEAAVAASYDPEATKYDMQWRLQPARYLYIVDLEEMAYQQIVKFVESNGRPPAKIIFYRDKPGMDSGWIVRDEVPALRRACLRLHVSYRPPLTYMTVQRKNPMRVTRKAGGASTTMPSGLVIESDAIGDLGSRHFYLYSRAGRKTTVTPTKYEIICNDYGFTVAQMQRITFDLCFMNTKNTCSTAYPLPSHLAYCAASRARLYRGHLETYTNGGDFDIKAMQNSKMADQSSAFYI